MATREHSLVVGTYANDEKAEEIVRYLYQAGFRPEQIAIDSQQRGTTTIRQTLIDMGMSHQEADSYEQALQEGNAIILVRADERQHEAATVLNRHESKTLSYLGKFVPHTMQLQAEQLEAEKHLVVSSEVRIRKRVVAEEKTITVRVLREEVEIEQVPITNGNGTADAPLAANEQIVTLAPNESIRIPVREERIFIEKRPMVREEIIIRKQAVEETKQFTDTIRKEVPRLEQEGQVPLQISENALPGWSTQEK